MSELIKKDFGTRVRALREQTGLSTKKFALMVGLSKPYIIQIEHGNRNISLDTIERIAAGLNMTPSELLEGVGSYTRN
ncbi:MAG TPA: helix-turn-helix domain-containing protein [Candidatus Gordonibacter avicola]|nr:helix-turn-helix domain-containing protein [Candidatus Gordonibacter avicola]